jgi:exonuclease SbcC
MITSLSVRDLRRLREVDLTFGEDDQLVLVAGRNGAGKCLPGETRLHDAEHGELVSIRDVVTQQRRHVLGVVNGQVRPVTVTHWHTLGPKPLVRITLADGAALTTATTHPVLTERGCVRAGELTVGDRVSQVAHLPRLGDDRISVEEAALVGQALSGDGVTPEPGARVPAELFHQSADRIQALLCGIARHDDWRTADAPITVATPQLADDVKLLLLRLGIGAAVRAAGETWQVLPEGGGPSRSGGEDLCWIPVTAIDDAGVDECFDITVDTAEHLYLAETFVVHNSTLFEAVLFAFYGESRHGRRDLDSIIRRGAEQARVTVGFRVDDTDYVVCRTRSRNTSNATLEANGVLVADRPSTVTATLSELLGLDGTGFRLAYLAQQGELDGLTSLRPAERSAAVGRLLRLDLLGAARDNARREAKAAKAALDALGTPADLNQTYQALRAARRDVSQAEQSLAATLEALREAEDAVAADAADTELAAALSHRARREGRRDALREAEQASTGRIAALEAELAALDTNGVESDLGPLLAELRQVDAVLSRAEVTQAVLAGRNLAQDELRAIDQELDELDDLDSPGVTEAQLACARHDLDQARHDLESAEDALRGATGDERAAAESHEATRRHLTQIAGQEDTCPTCATVLPGDRWASLVDDARSAATTAGSRVRDALDRVSLARQDLTRRSDAFQTCSTVVEQAHSRHQAAVAAQQRRRELTGRREVALAHLASSEGITAIDVDAVRRQRDLLDERVRLARQRAATATELAGERGRLRQTWDELEALGDDDPAVAEAVAQAALRRARRDAESQLAGDLAVTVAGARGAVAVARERYRNAVADHRRRRDLLRRANEAGDAAAVLERSATLLASRLQPALAAAVSDTLARLSAGRFPGVCLDADYGVRVIDDGAPRPLEELSGGEQDLVALAMRLGLAEVVSGGSGWGSLWLDEVLGSQDAARRQAVLDALRSLRSRWPQIVVVSHVDGIEDTVDSVVRIPGQSTPSATANSPRGDDTGTV